MPIIINTPYSVTPLGVPDAWQSFTGPQWTGAPYHTSASLMSNGKFMLSGSPSGAVPDVCKEFDPVSFTYSLVDDLPNNTAGELVSLSDGTVLAFRSSFNQSRKYDRPGNNWTLTTGSTAMDGSGSLVASNEAAGKDAFLFGGRFRTTGFMSNNVEYYNKSTELWTNAGANFPLAKQDLISVNLTKGPQAGKILVGGGGDQAISSSNFRYWFYNPNTDSYTETTSVPAGMYLHDPIGAVQLDNGLVYMAGGSFAFNNAAVNRTVTFDTSTETWAIVPVPLPWAVKGDTASMSKLQDGRIVLHRSNTSYVSTYI